MTGHVHEVQVRVADELDFGRFEQAVVVLAHETGVLDGLLGKVPHVGLGADDADVGGVPVVALVRQGDVLSDKHSDAYPGHVEAVEEGLDIVVDLHALALALVFEDALCHCRHHPIVPPLDLVERLREFLVVGLQVGWPVPGVVDHGEVPPGRVRLLGSTTDVLVHGGVLTLFQAGVGRGLGQHGRGLAVEAPGLQQSLPYFFVEVWPRKGGDFLLSHVRVREFRLRKLRPQPWRGVGHAAHLKRLCIPVGHPLDRGHVAEAIGEGVELFDSMCETDGEFFGEELRGSE